MYRTEQGPLHVFNPFTKLVVTLLVLWAAFGLPGVLAPLLVLGLALLPLSLWAGLFRPVLRLCWTLVGPTAAVLLVMQGLLYPGATHVLVALGPFAIYREGLDFAALISLRLLVMAAAFGLLLMTTHPGRLMSDLTRRGLSPSMAYLVVASLQIPPEMQERARAILDAQRARGLRTHGGIGQRIRALIPLVGPLVFGSLVASQERAVALDARAFNTTSRVTQWEEIADTRVEYWLRWGCVFMALLIGASRLWR